jgi:hypothetical protein
MAEWRRAGVDTVLSLLTPEEELDLDLKSEAREVAARGMKFASLPIPDRQVPNSEAEVSAALDQLDADLGAGRTGHSLPPGNRPHRVGSGLPARRERHKPGSTR